MKEQKKTFIFKKYDTDLKQGRIDFFYEVILPNKTLCFKEKLSFNPENIITSNLEEKNIKPILESLLLILGVSYWKLYCPEVIIVEPFVLNKEMADFWNTVYTNGLGEFYFKNEIDFRKLVNFPYSGDSLSNSSSFKKESRNLSEESEIKNNSKALLLFGGGKDSLVSAELLKKEGKNFSIYTLNDYSFESEAIKELNVEHITIKRYLDPKIFDENIIKESFKGHIPISLVYTFTSVLASILYGFNYIVASNEKSSNYGNTVYLGMEINHQWSKSLECENLVQKYIHNFIDPNLTYFSLLRPFKEIKIMEIFSLYPKYFGLFVSCNRNFVVNDDHRKFYWCGECPKCLFVFVLMAAFIPKKELIKIFGNNLFSEQTLLSSFGELLGIENIKPFDCVGLPEEVQIAFYYAYRRGEYLEDAAMKMFIDKFSKQFDSFSLLEKERFEECLSDHLIPEFFKSSISSIC